jgi:hypothetical protein
MGKDIEQWRDEKAVSDVERWIIRMGIGYFSAAEGIVGDNIQHVVRELVTAPELKLVLGRHAHEETPDISAYTGLEGSEVSIVRTEIVACPECEERRAKMKAAEGRRPDWPALKDVRDLAWWLEANLLEGMRFNVPEREWRRLAAPYSSSVALLLGASAHETLMENLVGSSWGAWIVERDVVTGNILIQRHPTGDKRTSVSSDRRHLFKKVDGEYIHWDVINSAEAVADIGRMLLR